MGLVQILIDDSTSKIITGSFSWDRDNGGTIEGPAGSSFPGTPVAKEWFWRTDENKLYRRNDGNTAWDAIEAVAAAHAASHAKDGSDEIEIANLSAGASTVGQLLRADGAGAAAWGSGKLSIAQTLTVGISGDVDYTSIATAVTAAIAAGASASQWWLVKVFPGMYTEAKMTIPTGVVVAASVMVRGQSVFVSPTVPTDNLFVLTGGGVFNLTCSGVTSSTKALYRCATPNTLSTIGDTRIGSCSNGIWVESGAAVWMPMVTASIDGASQEIDRQLFVTGAGSLALCTVFASEVPTAILPYYSVDPIRCSIEIADGGVVTGSTFSLRTAYKTTSQSTVKISGGGNFEGLGVAIKNAYIGVWIPDTGSGSHADIANALMEDNQTNFKIDSATGHIGYIGHIDSKKATLAGGAILQGILVVETGHVLELVGSVLLDTDLDMGTKAITNVGNVDGVDVSDHSARHENGGSDEISVAGLSGELADAQPPKSHALGTAHSTDTLANLNAKVSDATLIDTGDSRLSDARTPTAHAASHASAGGDTYLGNVTDDAQLKRAAGDINTFSTKGAPVGDDILLIEDNADSYAKKKILMSTLPGGVDTTAVHKATNAEISAMTEKTTLTGADVLVIEDSAASYAKKKVQVTNLPGGTDTNAVHKNVDAEISAITEKGTPIGADVILIEDSAASYAKKRIQITNLPAGVDTTAVHKATSGEINAIGEKTTPVNADVLLIEDSEATFSKKKVLLTKLLTDQNAIHKATSAEISAITEKTTPVGADVILIEDSAASYAKKRLQITNMPGGVDSTAIHKATSAEISAMTEKTVVVGDDLVVIEDSAASNAKKKVKLSTIGGSLGPKHYEVTDPYTKTTTSSSPVLVSGMTVTPAAGKYLVIFSGTVRSDSASSVNTLSITNNGAGMSGSARVVDTYRDEEYIPFACVVVVTATGSEAIEGRWATTSGTLSMGNCSMVLVKVSA